MHIHINVAKIYTGCEFCCQFMKNHLIFRTFLDFRIVDKMLCNCRPLLLQFHLLAFQQSFFFFHFVVRFLISRAHFSSLNPSLSIPFKLQICLADVVSALYLSEATDDCFGSFGRKCFLSLLIFLFLYVLFCML